MNRSTHTPLSHCSVVVHVFCGTTAPLSVMHAPAGSVPVSQLEGSEVRTTQDPLSHCRVSVHVLRA